MSENMLMKNMRAYPMIRKNFFGYLKGIETLPYNRRPYYLFWNYLKVRRTQASSRVTISEYFIFAFYCLSKEERLQYMTDYEATMYMRPFTEESKPYLWDKAMFLQTFSKFIHRSWMRVRDASIEEFEEFVRRNHTVASKPLASSWGIGFERLEFGNIHNMKKEYERLCRKDCILEEYLISDSRLAQFHPSSLNTVRIITFFNGERFQVFGAGLRVGTYGKFVDNAHGGGIFCEIDPETGRIVTDGLDEWGNEYDRHPNTGVKFRGFDIPRWEEMVELCRQASKSLPCLRIVGWDIALLKDGRMELIEGNHNPGMNIVQAPAKKGQKSRFSSMIEEYFVTGQKEVLHEKI